jgi:hypothetical protein
MKKIIPLNIDNEVYLSVQRMVGKGKVSELVNKLLAEYSGENEQLIDKEIKLTEDKLYELQKHKDKICRRKAVVLKMKRAEEEIIRPEYSQLKIKIPTLNYQSYKYKRLKEILKKEMIL